MLCPEMLGALSMHDTSQCGRPDPNYCKLLAPVQTPTRVRGGRVASKVKGRLVWESCVAILYSDPTAGSTKGTLMLDHDVDALWLECRCLPPATS